MNNIDNMPIEHYEQENFLWDSRPVPTESISMFVLFADFLKKNLEY